MSVCPECKTPHNTQTRFEYLAERAVDALRDQFIDEKKFLELAAVVQEGLISFEFAMGTGGEKLVMGIKQQGALNEVLSATTRWRMKYVTGGTELADLVTMVSQVLGTSYMGNGSFLPAETLAGLEETNEIKKRLDSNPWLLFIFMVHMGTSAVGAKAKEK